MKGKVDEDCEDSRDEEVVEVDQDESEGDEAEQAGGEDEGQQPETPTEGGKPAPTLSLVFKCTNLVVSSVTRTVVEPSSVVA